MAKFYCILILFIFQTNVKCEEIWLTKFSHHFIDCTEKNNCINKYNEVHQGIGFVNKSNYFIYVYNNSFSDIAVFSGKKYIWRKNKFFEPNIKLGLVYGYGDKMKINFGDIAPAILFGLDLNLNNNHTISFDSIPTEFISVGYTYKY